MARPLLLGSPSVPIRIIAPAGPVRKTGLMSKRELSRVIFDRIEGVLEKKRR